MNWDQSCRFDGHDLRTIDVVFGCELLMVVVVRTIEEEFDVVEMMVGRRIEVEKIRRKVQPAAELALEVSGLTATARNRRVLNDVSFGLRRAVIRLLAVWAVPQAAFYAMGLWVGLLGPSHLLFAPLTFLAVPVNPQGRGDYYLKREDGSIQLA